VTATAASRHRRPPWLTSLIVTLVVAVAAFFLGGGWYFASQLHSDALVVDTSPPKMPLSVVDVAGQSVTLTAADPAASDLTKPLLNGLVWPTGSGQLAARIGPVVGSRVTRDLTVTAGAAPVAGQPARLDNDVYRSDPKQALGLDFADVSFTSPAGQFAAWYVPPAGAPADPAVASTGSRPWAVMVHGKGATRTEMLRALTVVHAQQLPVLVITYRNDAGQPADASRLYRYGETEQQDLTGAVRFALDHGASRVVPVAASMGGAIVASFLRHSELAGSVAGVVLDAPMLDFDSVVNYGASQRRLPLVGLPLPAALTATAKWIAGWRYGVHWAQVDYLRDTDWVRVPVLILQGESDLTVPITDSAQLVTEQPSRVRLDRFPVAGHVESWNADRTRYETEVAGFLARIQ
jgi:pimeloyl-ACP methyl ester carboxylesterase